MSTLIRRTAIGLVTIAALFSSLLLGAQLYRDHLRYQRYEYLDACCRDAGWANDITAREALEAMSLMHKPSKSLSDLNQLVSLYDLHADSTSDPVDPSFASVDYERPGWALSVMNKRHARLAALHRRAGIDAAAFDALKGDVYEVHGRNAAARFRAFLERSGPQDQAPEARPAPAALFSPTGAQKTLIALLEKNLPEIARINLAANEAINSPIVLEKYQVWPSRDMPRDWDLPGHECSPWRYLLDPWCRIDARPGASLLEWHIANQRSGAR